MDNINDFLNRAADRCGFSRDTYVSDLVPKSYDKILLLPFFGNSRGEFIFSSFILPRLMDSLFSNRYVIVATHADRAFLYNGVSEVWGVKGEEIVDSLDDKSDIFTGNSDLQNQFIRSFNKFFASVYDTDDLVKYYNNGLTNYYFTNFGGGKIWYPTIPSLKSDVNNFIFSASFPVLISADMYATDVDKAGRTIRNQVPKEIYIDLCHKLSDQGFSLVFWRGPNCYDLSRELVGKAFFSPNRNLSGAVAMARACGFVLSLFNDLHSVAYLAKVPFLNVQSRNRYYSRNLFEFDELLSNPVTPYFSFPPPTFNTDIARSVVNKMIALKENGWVEKKPLIEKVQDVNHSKVRKKRVQKMGFHFFKVPEIED